MSLSPLLLGLLLPVDAPPAPDPAVLDTVQVRALLLGGADGTALPLRRQPVAAGPGTAAVDVAGLFDGIAGVVARDRGNRAQDLQLSIRGYGARSTFGVRGIRVLADGLPAGAPDGQAQLTHFSPFGLAQVQVVRGPFAALWGNASGGVVHLASAPARADGGQWLQLQAGDRGERSLAAQLQGGLGTAAWRLVPWLWEGEGARDYSRARRRSLSARMDVPLAAPGGHLMLVAQHFDAPDAQDPRPLTRAEWRADPRQASPTARAFGTRKSVRQDQAGLVLDRPLGRWSGRLAVHAGQRRVEQFLAIPASAQASPLHGGGVVDLDSTYGGVDARLEGGGEAFTWQLGLDAATQDQQRRGWENHRDGVAGVRGALRRDQRDTVGNADPYLQALWRPRPWIGLQAGLRHSNVRFRSHDRYITAANPDDSGQVRYRRWNPVLGLVLAPAPDWRWHLAAGRGTETPTFNELAYRADGGAGLALDLRPALGTQWETGLQWQDARGTRLSLTGFVADTRDELAVAGSAGGRTTYRNAGDTRRRGWELEWERPLVGSLRARLAWLRLDARVRACPPAGCAGLAEGARLPAMARDQLFAGLEGRHGAWTWQGGVQASGPVPADDAGTAVAPGHAVVDLSLSRRWQAGGRPLELQLAVDNLLDRDHIATVVPNDANGRYYEPGAGRRVRLGLRWSWDP